MKKLLTLLVLLVTTIGAWAQTNGAWTNPHTNQNGAWTTIFAKLQINPGEQLPASKRPYQGNYTLAAFVGYYGEEECRLVTLDNTGDLFPPLPTAINNQSQIEIGNNLPTSITPVFLILQVPGNYDNENDAQKPIYFMLKENSTGLIYRLDASQFVTFRDDAWGTPSNPVVLSVKLCTDYDLPSFDVEKGKWVYLPDLMTVTPEDASKPANAFEVEQQFAEYAYVSNDTLYGLKPVKGALVNILNHNTGEAEKETVFNVIQHATGINIVQSTYAVDKNNPLMLSMFMRNKLVSGAGPYLAYSLNPEDANDEVMWEYDEEYVQYTPGATDPWKAIKAGVTQMRPYIQVNGQKIYPQNPGWIEVTIRVPITNAYLRWDADNVKVICNVGDDIFMRIANRLVIEPEDAVKTFAIELMESSDDQYLTIGENSVKAIKTTQDEEIPIRIVPTGYDGRDNAFTVPVIIKNHATKVAWKKKIIRIKSDTPLQEVRNIISGNFTWTPEGSSAEIKITTKDNWGSGFIGGGGPGEVVARSFNFTDEETAMQPGDHVVVARAEYPDYSMYYGLDSDIVTRTSTAANYTVTIYAGLSDFTITVTPDEADPTTGTIMLVPNPEDAEYIISDFSINLTHPLYDNLHWTSIEMQPKGPATYYTYTSTMPGTYDFSVTKDNTNFGSASVHVPAKVELANGWQWKSNPYGKLTSADDVASFFTNKVVEARTYNKLLINDPEWGIMGTLLRGLSEAEMYKAKMSAEVNSFLYSDGMPINNEHAWSLQPGWNWVGSPYFYDRMLSHVFDAGNLVQGMVIVSKADGSAEYNGTAWAGNLKMLKAGEGYLFYNPTNAEKQILLPSEGVMSQGNDAAARASRHSVWSYDHSRFANNMTMVARMEGLPYAEQYTIGAFVGDECRGEGEFIDGLAFITVHANYGEQVSFRLHNELTDEYFDIDETVKSRQRVGSLGEPFMLTSGQALQVATGISDVRATGAAAQRYDLGGRRAVNSKVTLMRMANGTVRKVMK